ncbi:MAG: hypothetical protein QXR58_00100 [Candidatus Micrarchaeaceae archaeon]
MENRQENRHDNETDKNPTKAAANSAAAAPAEAGREEMQAAQTQQQSQIFRGIAAEIVEVNRKGKTGMYGEIYTVMCNVLEGRDKGRVIKRNILGPVKVGDIVRLVDTSREAKQISVK